MDPSHDSNPAVETGREGALTWWQVDGRQVELLPTARGWEARVRCPDWGGTTLDVDGRFASEEEARTWCLKMAATFAAEALERNETG